MYIYFFFTIESQNGLVWRSSSPASCNEQGHLVSLHKKLKDHNSPIRWNIVFKACGHWWASLQWMYKKKKSYLVLPQLWEQIQHDAEARWATVSYILQVPVRKGEWCLIHCLGKSPGELHTLSFCWWNSHPVMLNAKEWEGRDIYS